MALKPLLLSCRLLTAVFIDKEAYCGRQITMLTTSIDARDQLRQVDVPFLGDRAQLVPEDIFQADARFVATDDERALYHARPEVTAAAGFVGLFFKAVAVRLRPVNARTLRVSYGHRLLCPGHLVHFRRVNRTSQKVSRS